MTLPQVRQDIADAPGPCEIIGAPGNGFTATEQGHGVIGRRIFLRKNLKQLIPDRPAAFARQIEIAVMRQIKRRGPVGHPFVGNHKFIRVRQGISDAHADIPGIPLLAIGTVIAQLQPLLAFSKDFRLPNPLVEPHSAAMEMIGGIIDGQRVGLTVERKNAAGQPPGNPARDAAKIGMAGKVRFKLIEAQHHIRQPSLPVRHM